MKANSGDHITFPGYDFILYFSVFSSTSEVENNTFLLVSPNVEGLVAAFFFFFPLISHFSPEGKRDVDKAVL